MRRGRGHFGLLEYSWCWSAAATVPRLSRHAPSYGASISAFSSTI